MDIARETLQSRIGSLLGWEQRKRREATLIVSLFYALLAALAVPLVFSLAPRWAWTAPAAIFAVLTPYLLFTRRWREADTARTLAMLDKKLRLDERATTAWELLRHNDSKPVSDLVLRQAGEGLQGFDARALFPRSRNWYAWLLLPIFALWLAMLHFDARFDIHRVASRPAPALARELRDYARELQEKAAREALPKTLAAGRELEKVAQRGVDDGSEDTFRKELAALSRKLAAQTRGSGQVPLDAPASRRELADLRAELEAARESFDAQDSEAQGWQERLAGLTQLKKQLDLQAGGARELSRGELKALVDKLQQSVTAELDRRALLETEEHLKALTKPGTGRGEGRARGSGNGEKDDTAERPPENIPGDAPGDALGQKGGTPSLPSFKSGGQGQVKGAVGEGERSATFFKAKPAPGKSRLSQDEVISSYRRQAEAELHTEKIPEELKDTIRNYFLSLEKAK